MEYFRENEKGKLPLTTEKISIEVWNAIVAVFEKYAANQALSENFPKQCPEGDEIPDLEMPIKRIKAYEKKQDKYAVFDFIG